jgi:hypothetical protein
MKRLILFLIAIVAWGQVPAPGGSTGGGGGGGGTPGGSSGQIQYNNAGAFGGMSGTVWDSAAGTLDVLVGTDKIFGFSKELNGNIGTGYTLYTNFSGISAPTVSNATGDPGSEIYLTAIGGGNTSIVTTGTGGDGGNVSLYARGGGVAPAAAVAATGGEGGSTSILAGGGGNANNAANLGVNLGGKAGDILITGVDGGNAANGSSNTGGNGSKIVATLGSGGTGSTANGLDGTFLVTGGARGNANIAEFLTNDGTPRTVIRASGALGNRPCTAATLAAVLANNGDMCMCTDCQPTSGSDDTCTGSGGVWLAYKTASAVVCR